MVRAMTLQDLRRNNPPSNSGGGGGNRGGGAGGNRATRLFGGMDGVQEKHPKQENYCDMWTTTFCPNFTIWSFTFLNVCLQLIIYIASVIYTSSTEQGLNDNMFLGNSLETLNDFGMRMPYKIKEDVQVWRLLTSLYINHGFSQVIINSLGLMFSGFMVEAQLGSLRMMLFYFCAGIGGNLFAATVNDWNAAGAEPAMLAQFAALIAMYVYFWERLQVDWCARVCGLFLCVFFFVIAIYFLSSFADPYKKYMRFFKIAYPDGSGFFGGAIFGFFLIWVFLKPTNGSITKSSRRECILFAIGLIASMLIFVILLSVFMSSYEPKEYWDTD